ncbi:hypothetical protein [Clostridium botulinum]|uniref:hypothetical protein n=1 Tax=Clostridium botulinum TaxID=1491 RepID=UPI003DA667E5
MKHNTSKKTISVISAAALSKSGFEDGTKLLLITSLGLIKGSLVDTKNKNDCQINTVWENLIETETTILNKYEIDKKDLSSDSGKIFMKDIEITTTSNVKFNLPYMIVFTDQILGFSFSN